MFNGYAAFGVAARGARSVHVWRRAPRSSSRLARGLVVFAVRVAAVVAAGISALMQHNTATMATVPSPQLQTISWCSNVVVPN